MNLQSDCLVCLLNQSLRVAKNLNLDEDKAQNILRTASSSISTYSNVSPPVAASDLYPKLSDIVGTKDIYENLKAISTQEALKLLPSVKENISKQPNRIKGAIKASVAGNVIDFATPNHFNLTTEFQKVFSTPFAIDNEDEFLDRLSKANSLMIVGDNVGEHVFDKILLEEIAKKYPDTKLYYAVRGQPIINDVTTKEAKEIAIDEVATIVDSGVDTPGLAYERASDEFMRLYNSMDLIIAKGMGNYECLDDVRDDRLYHLFKVKCEVVASSVGAKLGELIFK
ncbi:MAG: DUF89 family protein [Epsilonproteobacteria bacterium]|nr:DUF89 family protein [Campylobacterota bacterium]